MKWLTAAAVVTILSVPAFAQIGVYIGRNPPPIRYESRPNPPGEGYQWVDGYWGVQSGRYVWVNGRWDRPPYEGGYWTHPHYDHYQQGWRMHEGHWDHEDHRDHEYQDHNNQGGERHDDHGGDSH
jgi:hypothetical protein